MHPFAIISPIVLYITFLASISPFFPPYYNFSGILPICSFPFSIFPPSDRDWYAQPPVEDGIVIFLSVPPPIWQEIRAWDSVYELTDLIELFQGADEEEEESSLPWQLTVHFRHFPQEELIPCQSRYSF